jgi:hypothetical protein
VTSKFRSSNPATLVYVEPNLPRLRPGQRKLSIVARTREDADMARARVQGYPWATLIASGPYRTGTSTWTFILNDDNRSPAAEAMAKLRAGRVAEGKCWECPSPAKAGHKRCEPCLERKRLREKIGPMP